MLVDVVVLRSAPSLTGIGALTYAVPEALRAGMARGVRVVVPLAGRDVTGVVVDVDVAAKDGVAVKLVGAVLDAAPVVDGAQIELSRFVARYYEASFVDALRLVLPPDTEDAPRRRYVLSERGERARVFFQSEGLNAADVALLQSFETGVVVDEARLKRAGGTRPRVQKLIDKGLVQELSAARPMTPAAIVETLHPLDGGKDIPRAATAVAALDAWVRACVEQTGDAPTMKAAETAVGGARKKAEKLVELARLRIDRQARDPLRRGRHKGHGPASTLTSAQEAALAAITTSTPPSSFLLEGVTGSGKTEVYLRALQHTLSQGRGALLLVPEIGLTPQLVGRVEAAVSEGVVVLHSQISEADRRDSLQLLREGRARIVVGARSAVFAPVPRLGLIIVDEEHEPSLKQDDLSPRYHARDVALWRAQHEGAVCVLGSATPSLETRHNVTQGKLVRLHLPTRVGGGGTLPSIEIVDLKVRKEIRAAKKKDRAVADDFGGTVLTAPLVQAIADTLVAGEQVLLFLNRRGWSSTITCDACGTVRMCPQCSVALTLHRNALRGASLRCHQCGYAEPFGTLVASPAPSTVSPEPPAAVALVPAMITVPPPCPACGTDGLVQLGTGTERVEAEVQARFPDARILRLDRDAQSKHDDVVRALARIAAREVDVVIGTQMIAKGHDWPAVGLVGVVNADVALTLPDFRAAERAMSLLTQVAGRAGRGEKRGRVVVQTYDPGHVVLKHLVAHDAAGFAAVELMTRAQHHYPPFSRLARVRIEHEHERTAFDLANEAASLITAAAATTSTWTKLSGPVLAPLERVQNKSRVHLLVFAKDVATRAQLLAPLRSEGFVKSAQRASARVVVDVDPSNML